MFNSQLIERRLIFPGANAPYSSGGGGLWTPASLTLRLWLDANDPASVNSGSPTDGDFVSTWKDKSSNLYHMTQASAANQFQYKTGILNSLPGLLTSDPAGLINGASGMTNASLSFVGSNPFTVLMVFTFNDYSPRAGTLICGLVQFGVSGGGTCPYLGLDTRGGSSGKMLFTSQAASGFPSVRTTDSFATKLRPYNLALPYDGGGTTASFYSANTLLSTLSCPRDYGNAGFYIGSLELSYGLVGYFHELVIASGVLSAADLLNWQNYVTAKWGTIAV